MRKLRLSEMKVLINGHTARKLWIGIPVQTVRLTFPATGWPLQ